MIELVSTWSKEGQGWFVFGCMIVLIVAIVSICETVQVLFRGHSKEITYTSSSSPCQCLHPDNLTQFCVNKDGDCVTKEECDACIQRYKENA